MPRTNYPAKYLDMIDDETWDFIETTESYFPASKTPLTVEDRRKHYNKMCRAFHNGYPEGVTASDDVISTAEYNIPIRRYERANASKGAQVVFYHGGGFVVGGLESHDDVCADICDRTGFVTTAVDYRLAPENVHPADFNDALAAFHHIVDNSDKPIVLVGDSAGASLCAAVSQAAGKKRERIAGQVLIYPVVGLEPEGGSYDDHELVPMLNKKDINFYSDARTGGDESIINSITCSPIKAKSFADIPSTVTIAAECDPLLDDAHRYHEALVAAGVPSYLIVEKGLVHGYLRGRTTVTRIRNSFTRIVEAVEALGQGLWPY